MNNEFEKDAKEMIIKRMEEDIGRLERPDYLARKKYVKDFGYGAAILSQSNLTKEDP